jgi:hypothetical protein
MAMVSKEEGVVVVVHTKQPPPPPPPHHRGRTVGGSPDARHSLRTNLLSGDLAVESQGKYHFAMRAWAESEWWQ